MNEIKRIPSAFKENKQAKAQAEYEARQAMEV